MSSPALVEELDQAVEKILSGEFLAAEDFDPIVQELLPIANDLRFAPRQEFREALLAGLAHCTPRAEIVPIRVAEVAILPTLFNTGSPNYAMYRSNFVVSAALHAAALALIFTSSLWLARQAHPTKTTTAVITSLSPYLLRESATKTGGGGGGGDHDKLPAARGDAPSFAREQITPPAIVVRNDDQKLAVQPTVIGPPNIALSKLGNTGDPLSAVFPAASNGTGVGGGIGTGSGGGIGGGAGGGVGAGYGGGLGGGVYRVGNGVSAPTAIYDPEPQYTDEARKSRMQGVVLLAVVVGPDGRTHNIHVGRSLGMGLDEKAIEAVRTWRFSPAEKDGQPVAVLVNIEVNFRLY